MANKAHGKNPYAKPVTKAGSAPDPSNEFIWAGPGRYSVPDVPESTDPDWTTGYSPTLKAGGSPDGSALPDDIRTGHREPPPNNPNDHAWNAVRQSEFHQRHSVETTSEMWQVQQHTVPRPRVPLWEQDRLPVRPTATNSPTGYAFTRPWHIPRNIHDAIGEDAVAHFSMADHRRNFEIMGMVPRGRTGVNTYRATPRPWDEQLFIPPPAGQKEMLGGIAGNQNFRL